MAPSPFVRSWRVLCSTAVVFLVVHCTVALALTLLPNPARRQSRPIFSMVHPSPQQQHSALGDTTTTPSTLSTRRAWLWTAAGIAVVVAPGTAVQAYERRDVGGSDASPETKAMNEQAYQTQSRLERAGLRVEVGNVT